MNVLGLIPARGGSKAIPHKNLTPLLGKPLIAYTLQAAQKCHTLSRVLVSTDNVHIAEMAKTYGTEVPFLRPAELAQDDTPALLVVQHAIDYLMQTENWLTDIVVYLQPTSPLRRSEHVDAAVNLLITQAADTVVSVVQVPHQFNPISVMRLEGDHLIPFIPQTELRLRRQDKPLVYARNGPSVLVCTYNTVMRQNTLYGQRTLPLVMQPEESVDIDSRLDLVWAECLLQRSPHPDFVGKGE
jgi:CMP-N,N'-diacetyllegionaminic acid synthase